MAKTKLVVVMALLSLLTLSAFSAVNTNTFVQADVPTQTCGGSGQIAMAHWIEGSVTIDAVFAEQLVTADGVIYSNGLYIKVIHAFGVSEAVKSLDAGEICWESSLIRIAVEGMQFVGRAGLHDIDLVWYFKDVPAEIIISEYRGHHLETYYSDWATVCNPTVDAFVIKDKGNTNTLTITVTKPSFDYPTNVIKETPLSETFTINNNAAGTYVVGGYNVFVDTKGNDQIRACYIVTK